MGPGYRLVQFQGLPVKQFLNTGVYGRRGWYNDRADFLHERYEDYFLSKRVIAGGKTLFLLPYPFAIGDDWYEAAAYAIVADLVQTEQWKQWQKFWRGLHIFKKHESFFMPLIKDLILSFFIDFSEMVGL